MQEAVEKRNLPGTASGSCGSSDYYSARIQRMIEQQSHFSSDLEFRTAFSKDHWTVVEPESRAAYLEDLPQDTDVAKLKESWRRRSLCFVENGISLGRKIGEGGQADIFEAFFQKRNCHLVAKVFKEKDSLSSLLRQCPTQIFQFEGNCKYIIRVIAGVILNCIEDLSLHGRFAFLMFKYQDDLRTVIDRIMMRNSNRGVPPFEADKAFRYMIEIACGMKILHSKKTLHRDLKASNILVWSTTDEQDSGNGEENFYCAVADYECSIGVFGTTFWRAPEVLQALQDRRIPKFTTKADVYSFAMTCCEILTGSVPLEDLSKSDYSFVLSGGRPELPRDVSRHMRELLCRCWHAIPDERPEFSEIVERLGLIMTTELDVPQETVEILMKPTPDYFYS
jgi:serine/threonine protein kinase